MGVVSGPSTVERVLKAPRMRTIPLLDSSFVYKHQPHQTGDLMVWKPYWKAPLHQPLHHTAVLCASTSAPSIELHAYSTPLRKRQIKATEPELSRQATSDVQRHSQAMILPGFDQPGTSSKRIPTNWDLK
jgi:hypothetical protein